MSERVAKISTAQGTRDIALAALGQIEKHEAVCAERAVATTTAVESIKSDVRWIMRSSLVAIAALAGDILVRFLH